MAMAAARVAARQVTTRSRQSSAHLFGLVGCTPGCIDSARLLTDDGSEADRQESATTSRLQLAQFDHGQKPYVTFGKAPIPIRDGRGTSYSLAQR